MKTALIAGATGLVGKESLYQLLESDNYNKVIALVRRPLPIKNPKLQEIIIDFDSLPINGLDHKVDDVYLCIGTTIKTAGTQDKFKQVDFGYNVGVAKICKSIGASRVFLVSALGADKNSGIFYNRIKGETEDAIAGMGYTATHFFRPSMLLGSRKEFRPAELVGKGIMRILGILFIGPLKEYKAIPAATVAKAMVHASLDNKVGIVVHSNREMLEGK